MKDIELEEIEKRLEEVLAFGASTADKPPSVQKRRKEGLSNKTSWRNWKA
jgi:hypothetical protein